MGKLTIYSPGDDGQNHLGFYKLDSDITDVATLHLIEGNLEAHDQTRFCHNFFILKKELDELVASDGGDLIIADALPLSGSETRNTFASECIRAAMKDFEETTGYAPSKTDEVLGWLRNKETVGHDQLEIGIVNPHTSHEHFSFDDSKSVPTRSVRKTIVRELRNQKQ
jgi:hypothetical protein